MLSQIEEQKMQLLVSLADAGLIFLSSIERSALRFGRFESSTAADELMSRHDRCSNIADITRAIVAASFYPRLLVRQGNLWRNIITNQMVNDTGEAGKGFSSKDIRWLTFASARQDKAGRFQVNNVSEVPPWALALLLGQTADFHFYAQVLRLDGGRVELLFSDPKALVAVRLLREQLTRLFDEFLGNPRREWKEEDEFWLNKLQEIASLRTQEGDAKMVPGTWTEDKPGERRVTDTEDVPNTHLLHRSHSEKAE